MKNMAQFIIVLIAMFILGSCEKEEVEDGILFYWNQTGCADPWGTDERDSNKETGAAIKAYLKGEGISAVDIIGFENILEEGVVGCDSCFCITGIRIIVEVPDSDEAKMLALGFSKN